MIALLVIALFWLAIAAFLLLAPADVFKSAALRTRRYGALGAAIFAVFCLIGFLAS